MFRFLLISTVFTLVATQTSLAQVSFKKATGFFLGKPYVAATLEGDSTEQLIIHTEAVDCTTFVEYVMASLLSNEMPSASNTAYRQMLQQLRYRNGTIYTYASRLHYFSEWLAENQKNGYIREITLPDHRLLIQKPIDFMSTHASAYPALQKNKALIDSIRIIEKQLSDTPVYIIPKEEVEAMEAYIETGDLIAITTSIAGLDITHVGFAKKINNRIHLLHASSSAKKVIIDPLPLSQYIGKQTKASGIRVFRLTTAIP